jgi:hypothetical protein
MHIFSEHVGWKPFSEQILYVYMLKSNCVILDSVLYNIILKVNVFDSNR